MVREQCLQDGVLHTLKRNLRNGILKVKSTLIMWVLPMTNQKGMRELLTTYVIPCLIGILQKHKHCLFVMNTDSLGVDFTKTLKG